MLVDLESKKCLHLFEGYGIELEYMIVNKKTLDVAPVCDELLKSIAGSLVSELSLGTISYSNELALHVVELKTTGPVKRLSGLADLFLQHVQKINEALSFFDACLLPTAAHPWMDPEREMRLWEYENNPIYEAYHRIFNCRGHGWANLQSTHINLPFSGNDEFSMLHSAIRLLLPIMPALSASSPIMDAQVTGMHDARLAAYMQNQKAIPSIAGKVVPEPVHSFDEYQQTILEPMYRDIQPYDPEGLLQFEWLNSRGAIARFDRSTIEIRVLDIQECPQADLAIAQAITSSLQQLIDTNAARHYGNFPSETLFEIYQVCVKEAEQAYITDRDFLAIFGKEMPCRASELWSHIVKGFTHNEALTFILKNGTLSSRILKAAGHKPTKEKLHTVYNSLRKCLATGKMYVPDYYV